MRRFPLAVAAACTLLVGTTGLAATAAPAPADHIDSTKLGRYIVVLDEGAAARTVAATQSERFGFEVGHV